MIKAVIVDDKLKARQLLQALLTENCPAVQVLAQAENVPEAVKIIKKEKPDLVFLDVEMPEEDGFAIFNYFENVDFEVIFTTAHHSYAMKAFEVSAIGYLLKPIEIEKLVSTVDRAIKLHGQNQIQQRLQLLKSNFQGQEPKKLALPVSDGLLFVNTDDIIYLKADGAYTHLILKNDKKLVISKNLKEFEMMLDRHSCFFRSHRSFIININQIEKYNKTEGGFIELSNGHHADLSRDKKEEFEELLKTVA